MEDGAQAPQSAPPERVFDPFEATLGLRHRDIIHMLEILSEPQAPRANKIKALRLLNENLPGRQHEAEMNGALDILKPYLMQPPNGLLLNTLVCFNTLINTEDLARKMLPDVPRIVEIISPDLEPPLRIEAAKLLRIIAEFVGEESPFISGGVPKGLVAAVSDHDATPEFLREAYGLLSRLANQQNIRIPLIGSEDFLSILVRSFAKPMLRQVSIILASNIAMDPSHRGKLALLNADILPNIAGFLKSEDEKLRYAILSLIALLGVPKDGKNDIATDDQLPDLINNIIKNDPDESCRNAADEVRVLVSELPYGRAIMGGPEEENN
ncbi:hypothetical protein M9Y10_044985 [Tritrichomonas musculus]|uniref:Uncharacterized protein n=1 Tax=Tritrichomonas musculus TaxID=1915356 RepID=A0ABR2JUQ8_9EUKA